MPRSSSPPRWVADIITANIAHYLYLPLCRLSGGEYDASRNCYRIGFRNWQNDGLMLAERGFDVGVTWHSDEKGALATCREIEARGQRAEAIHLDLSNLPEGAKAIETLITRFGRLDVLVNNAGVMNKAPFLDLSFDDWRHIFTVDVDGAFLCSQIAARQMVKQGEGGGS